MHNVRAKAYIEPGGIYDRRRNVVERDESRAS